MTDSGATRSDGEDERSRWTRRTVLGACATTAGVATGVGGVGSATAGQTESPDDSEGITTTAMVPEPDRYDQDILGFWIHLANQLDPDEGSPDAECPGVDWARQEAIAFDAYIIDRTAEPETARITLYLRDTVDVTPGQLYIINEVHPCDVPYLGIRIEQIGADAIQVGPRATDLGEGAGPTPGPTEGTGPGMGLPATVAALLGGGWLAHWLRREERQ